MSYVSQHLSQAAAEDRWTVQARAERLRGEVMRGMISALGRKIAAAFAGRPPAGGRAAGQAV